MVKLYHNIPPLFGRTQEKNPISLLVDPEETNQPTVKLRQGIASFSGCPAGQFCLFTEGEDPTKRSQRLKQ